MDISYRCRGLLDILLSGHQGLVGIGLVVASVLLNRHGGWQGLVEYGLVAAKVLLDLAWWPPKSCWN
jgi:hypothetical protein